jgi:hypothetical protein
MARARFTIGVLVRFRDTARTRARFMVRDRVEIGLGLH